MTVPAVPVMRAASEILESEDVDTAFGCVTGTV